MTKKDEMSWFRYKYDGPSYLPSTRFITKEEAEAIIKAYNEKYFKDDDND